MQLLDRPADHVPQVQVRTLAQRPDLVEEMDLLHDDAWDEFLNGAPWDHWDELFDVLAEYQLILIDPSDQVIGLGHTVPFAWDGTIEDLPPKLDDIIARSLDDVTHERPITAFSALAAVVKTTHLGQGLSSLILRNMVWLAGRYGAESLVAPVGPTKKHLYPLTPMERYVRWERADGSPFDPWIRVHWRLGAEQLAVAPTTAICTGTIADWQKWTKLEFPESGEYIVPGALQPVHIDVENDIGCYEDPGIWMRHRIPRGTPTASDARARVAGGGL
jgi:hypothetical protein